MTFCSNKVFIAANPTVPRSPTLIVSVTDCRFPPYHRPFTSMDPVPFSKATFRVHLRQISKPIKVWYEIFGITYINSVKPHLNSVKHKTPFPANSIELPSADIALPRFSNKTLHYAYKPGSTNPDRSFRSINCSP